MKNALIILSSLVFALSANATHNRSGEILYKRVAPFGTNNTPIYTYSITVIKYMDHGATVADRCVDTVYFGDGQKGVAPRINGGTGLNCGCSGTIQCGQLIVQQNGYTVKKSIYSILHTYAGAGVYTITSSDPNRNAGIHNIPNSASTPFYLEARLVISSVSAMNSSPEFGSDPVNQATLGVCFIDDLQLYDADGDSLITELINCGAAPGYFDPELPVNGTYGLLSASGPLQWCSPVMATTYHIAYRVNEFRYNGSGFLVLIGSVMREREVIVKWAPVGLNEMKGSLENLIYPNPVSSSIYLNLENSGFTEDAFYLIDLNGRISKLKQEPSGTDRIQFDLSEFESGLYFLRAERNGKMVYWKVAKD